MKSYEVDGQMYDISLEEYHEMQEQAFAEDFGIPVAKARSIIEEFDLRGDLADRYDEEIGESLVREAREFFRDKGIY